MLQFGNSRYREDPQCGAIAAFIAKFLLEMHAPESALRQLRELVRTSPEPGKSLLIYVRLFFWGYFCYDEALQDIGGALTRENFDRLGAFERTEIATCLGPRLLSALIPVDFSEVRGYREFPDDGSTMFREFEGDEVWCYGPPPAGFFSVVENVMLAKFLCLLQRKTFKIDDNLHTWWRYPVHFNELFGAALETGKARAGSPEKYLHWNTVYQLFSTATPGMLHALANFKREEYRKIKAGLDQWLAGKGDGVSGSPEGAVYFIRGGDKLVLETMSPPAHVIARDFELLFKISDRFMVLSDDYQLAQNFADGFGCSKVENITERGCGGYFCSDLSSVDDVRIIVKNYLTLASVKYSMSCPSSNLVNAAHWSNEGLVPVHLNSTPLLKYAYL